MAKVISLLLLLLCNTVYAESLFMVRAHGEPENVMNSLQQSLKEYGYKLAHIQKCDGGLGDVGYKTDYYKVLFFAKPEQMRYLSNKYPQMIPHLILKLAIFVENGETLVTGINPISLSELFATREIKIQLHRWSNDIEEILFQLRQQFPDKKAD